MKTTTRYSPEFRQRAVRMVFEHQGEHKTQWAAIVSIATKIGCAGETLRKWVRQAMLAGKRLQRLANPGVFVYVRHGRNAWQFTPGSFLNPAGWERIAPPSMFPPGLFALYRAACVNRPGIPGDSNS